MTLTKGDFMRILMALMIGLMLSSCKSGESASCGSKDFFSIWTATDLTHYVDFTGGSFGPVYSVYFDVGGGSRCILDISASGNQCTGDITISNSIHNGVGADPGCASLNGTSQFTKNNNGLSVCSGGSCDDYQ
jgi:hypothetical protein